MKKISKKAPNIGKKIVSGFPGGDGLLLPPLLVPMCVGWWVGRAGGMSVGGWWCGGLVISTLPVLLE